MNKLHISPEAQNDLIEIIKYIQEELDNPKAASRTLSSITKRLRQLGRYAQLGAALSSIIGIESNYRVLICDHYLAFYRITGSDVYIDRILYGKRDYLRILFNEMKEPEEGIN